ncbi:hypothetical protein DB895_04695 [Flavobacterium psychrotolerans]|uniref:Uncharacterized protein n=1 Tax=Flavobacterium psychrotolerans TaxID=2169410 RepID=A0A2U1JM26_9FLAO|nr:hypothetical protein DB895_04695 [Flavobacterium psychrotolerans]
MRIPLLSASNNSIFVIKQLLQQNMQLKCLKKGILQNIKLPEFLNFVSFLESLTMRPNFILNA